MTAVTIGCHLPDSQCSRCRLGHDGRWCSCGCRSLATSRRTRWAAMAASASFFSPARRYSMATLRLCSCYTEKTERFAPSYSITSSARASKAFAASANSDEQELVLTVWWLNFARFTLIPALETLGLQSANLGCWRRGQFGVWMPLAMRANRQLSKRPFSPPAGACSSARSPTELLRAAGAPRPRDSDAIRHRGWRERR